MKIGKSEKKGVRIMYDDGLKEAMKRASTLVFKDALLKELEFQKGLLGNSVWLSCLFQVFKNVFCLSNGKIIWPYLEEANPDDLTAWIEKELDKQKYLMEKEQGKKTNFYRPFCSLIWAVLERIARNEN